MSRNGHEYPLPLQSAFPRPPESPAAHAQTGYYHFPPPPGTPSPAVPLNASPVNSGPSIPPRPPGFEIRSQTTPSYRPLHSAFGEQAPQRPNSKVYTSFPPPPPTPQPSKSPGHRLLAPPVQPPRPSSTSSTADGNVGPVSSHHPLSGLQVPSPQGLASFPPPPGPPPQSPLSMTPVDFNNLSPPPPGPPPSSAVSCQPYTGIKPLGTASNAPVPIPNASYPEASQASPPPTYTPQMVIIPDQEAHAASQPQSPQIPDERRDVKFYPSHPQHSVPFPPPPTLEDCVEIEDVDKMLQSMTVQARSQDVSPLSAERSRPALSGQQKSCVPNASVYYPSVVGLSSGTTSGSISNAIVSQPPLRERAQASVRPEILPPKASYQAGPDQGLDEPYHNWNNKPPTLPLCPRDEPKPDGSWYGWCECTICPECYVGICKDTILTSQMTLRGTHLSESVMCEMYSPRMRKLYAEACSKNDTTELLQFSDHRRRIFAETVPQCRMMLFQQQQGLKQQQMLNLTSSLYKNAGQIKHITHGDGPYSYSVAGVGSGNGNRDLAKGAALQAQGIAQYQQNEMMGAQNILLVKGLEKKWRAVE